MFIKKEKIRTGKNETVLAHGGSDPAAFHGAVNVPPHRMSTVVFETYADFENRAHQPFVYGRAGTPGSTAFEHAIAALEEADNSVATCSGLSAILTALLAFAKSGDHILMPDNCYGPARKSCEEILQRFGVNVEYYPPMIGAEIEKMFRDNTKLLFMEAPGSLTYETPDIGALVAAAQKSGIKTAIDNSWGTPLFFKPVAFGIDLSVMSATKYISGHSDIIMGVVSGNGENYDAAKRTALMLGLSAGSEELYLGLRGLRTLDVRLRQHQKNALYIATWLQGHPAVKRVLYPGLPSCPGHDNWQKYFSGASGTFSIIIHEEQAKHIAKMLDHMKLFGIGFSWGGFESLLFPEQPAPSRSAETWTESGFSLRIHIGLENVDDLKTDLEEGLARLK